LTQSQAFGAFEVDGQDAVAASRKYDYCCAGILGCRLVNSQRWHGDVADATTDLPATRWSFAVVVSTSGQVRLGAGRRLGPERQVGDLVQVSMPASELEDGMNWSTTADSSTAAAQIGAWSA